MKVKDVFIQGFNTAFGGNPDHLELEDVIVRDCGAATDFTSVGEFKANNVRVFDGPEQKAATQAAERESRRKIHVVKLPEGMKRMPSTAGIPPRLILASHATQSSKFAGCCSTGR